MTLVQPPVLISAFANERAREWPCRHFRRFIELILADPAASVLLVGTRAQRVRGNEIVRGFSAERVVNGCGTMTWDQLVDAVDAAPYVVSNNSGIAHLAAMRDHWTLCLFSSSHAYVEWIPRGPKVVVIERVVSCGPCCLGGDYCPNGRVCMYDMDPDVVFRHFRQIYAATDTARVSAA
jgi:ADP-heptose:LPS heptosyltransferase